MQGASACESSSLTCSLQLSGLMTVTAMWDQMARKAVASMPNSSELWIGDQSYCPSVVLEGFKVESLNPKPPSIRFTHVPVMVSE